MYDGSRQHASFAHKFTGKERDAESGLDNFEARYLGSSLGRFMSPDPMGGHLQDPQTLNRYAYVRNNPLSLTDPTGLDFYLSCQHTDKNGDVCQQQQVGTDSKGNAVNAWVQGASDDNGKFTATQIGNNPDGSGGLIDKTTGTGSYTGTFDGQNVTFTNAEGKQSTGDWVQGTDKTSGIAGGGDLGNRFQFTFMDHGADQTLNFDFQFHGTRDLAESILERAGYKSGLSVVTSATTSIGFQLRGRTLLTSLFRNRPELPCQAPKGVDTWANTIPVSITSGTTSCTNEA